VPCAMRHAPCAMRHAPCAKMLRAGSLARSKISMAPAISGNAARRHGGGGAGWIHGISAGSRAMTPMSAAFPLSPRPRPPEGRERRLRRLPGGRRGDRRELGGGVGGWPRRARIGQRAPIQRHLRGDSGGGRQTARRRTTGEGRGRPPQ
jgi:hypothetical protein